MKENYQFPSISTLTKITYYYSCANQTSGAFLNKVFHSLETKQKIVFCYMMRSIFKKCCSITEAKSLEKLKKKCRINVSCRNNAWTYDK